MKIRFVGQGGLRTFKDTYENEGEEILLFGFAGMGEVSYKKELKGESSFFEEAAILSKTSKATVVCGCITDTHGMKRKSALVAENGRLCGVSDMLNVMDGEMSPGADLRIYSTKVGRIGVAVAEDVFYPEVIKSLVLCGSEFIVCPFGKLTTSLCQVLLRAYAYTYGVPIFFCGIGYCMIADIDGSIAFASPQSPMLQEFDNKKEYHLLETRRRGFLGRKL